MRLLIALLSLLPATLMAQSAVDFDINFSNPAAPEATWSTSPSGASCSASGLWSGGKGSTGTEILAPVRTGGAYTLNCAWAGDTVATVTWTNPVTNTDGSAYNPSTGVTRLVWTPNGDLDSFDCLTPSLSGLNYVDEAGSNTAHVVTGLGPTGIWEFGAYAVNAMGFCSNISNTVSKTFTGAVTVTDSITITIPGAVTQLGVD